jgi:hypothetical protein
VFRWVARTTGFGGPWIWQLRCRAPVVARLEGWVWYQRGERRRRPPSAMFHDSKRLRHPHRWRISVFEVMRGRAVRPPERSHRSANRQRFQCRRGHTPRYHPGNASSCARFGGPAVEQPSSGRWAAGGGRWAAGGGRRGGLAVGWPNWLRRVWARPPGREAAPLGRCAGAD